MQRLALEYGHTCMNRFLMLDYRGHGLPDMETFGELAATLCATPIADDLLLLQDSDQADVRLRIVGGDRREADFCGNGMIYTAARIGAELGSNHISIESASGVKQAVKTGQDWKVEVGPAVKLHKEQEQIPAEILRGIPLLALIRAGEPHLVMELPPALPGFHVEHQEFESYCEQFRDATTVSGGVSITMVFQRMERSLLIRTYERGGRRHTFSCGTGSVSAIATSFGTPEDGETFCVCAPGGIHHVQYEEGCWYLLASPQPIAHGYLENTTIQLPLSGLSHYTTPAFA